MTSNDYMKKMAEAEARLQETAANFMIEWKAILEQMKEETKEEA